LQWQTETNRKSYVAYQMAPLVVTWTGLEGHYWTSPAIHLFDH